MAKYIDCKRCDSPNCKGCNINTLSKMLDAGKFDCIMDEHHSINPTADVVEVRHGEWVDTVTGYACSVCHEQEPTKRFSYCPNCGAKMDGVTDTNVGDKMDGKGEGE